MINIKIGHATNSSSYHSTIVMSLEAYEKLSKGEDVTTSLIQSFNDNEGVQKLIEMNNVKVNSLSLFGRKKAPQTQEEADNNEKQEFEDMNWNNDLELNQKTKKEFADQILSEYSYKEFNNVVVLDGEIQC